MSAIAAVSKGLLELMGMLEAVWDQSLPKSAKVLITEMLRPFVCEMGCNPEHQQAALATGDCSVLKNLQRARV